MKAARIGAYEAQPVVEEVAMPQPGPGEVLVRVEAAALNPLDVKIQQGVMQDFFPVDFPYTLGTDLAGTVEAVGPDVDGWTAGDLIAARTDPTWGAALAEHARVPATHLASRPVSLSPEQAAAAPIAAGTAWQALFELADLQANESVLVHAGAGGVGSFAIQMARNAGARVIATASGDGLEIARRLGAHQVIDYRAQASEDVLSDLDLVLDTVGGDTQQRSFGVLRRGGRLVSSVQPPDPALARAHGVEAEFVFHQSDAARLAEILDQISAGRLAPLVDRVVAMEDLQGAFARQASGHARGKIILLAGAV